MKYLFLNLLCAAAFAFPSAERANETPFFQCELINIASPDAGKSRLIILAGVPIDALSFVKTGEEYEARFGISIAVIDRDGFGMAEREAQEKIRLQDYAETNSLHKYYFDRFEFDLPPGKYTATVTVTDAASGRQASLSIEKALQNFSANNDALALSDLIITPRLESDSAGRSSITPGFFQSTSSPGQDLFFYLEIKSQPDGAPVQVRQILRNRQNKVMVDQQRPWPCRTALEKMMLPIWTDHLPYGAYELEMQVQQGKMKKSARQKFRLIWNGIPEAGMHLQQALAQAALIASSSERKSMEKIIADSSLACQRETLIAFWEKRNRAQAAFGNEAMTSFYQRVDFVNEKFGGNREGWKTDFGRIFIQLGAPDVIEVDSKHSRQQRRQIWRYHRLQRHFLFVDALGRGDFVLAQEQ